MSLRRLKPYLRLSAFVLVTCAALGSAAVARARSDVGDAMLAFGREVAPLAGEGRILELNGQPLRVQVSSIDGDIGPALAIAEDACVGDAADLEAAIARLSPEARASVEAASRGGKLGVLHRERAGEGVVACFARRADEGRTLLDRVKALGATGDLAELGRFRLVHARSDHGTATRLFALQAEGALPLTTMFPSRGDASGTDHDAVPRPPASRRLLSARVVGTTYGAFVYETTDSGRAALAAIGVTMTARGWTEAEPPPTKDHDGVRGNRAAAPSELVRGYAGRGRFVVVSASPGDASVVTIVELGQSGTAPAAPAVGGAS